MALKPWLQVIHSREDLRDGRRLTLPSSLFISTTYGRRRLMNYKNPERFFDRTFLTSSLRELQRP